MKCQPSGSQNQRRQIMTRQSEPQSVGERRRYPQLRAIYPEARNHIDHLFHNRHDWAGSPIDYLAQRVIKESYPHLHGEEIRILVTAIERAHRALADAEIHH
jgi:hypothetical protein